MENKQLTFFPEEPEFKNPAACDSTSEQAWKMYIDGASRNNPGPAGAGFCLIRGTKTIFEHGFFLGTRTNNQAEYLALLIGLHIAQEFLQPKDQLLVFSDSQLLVRQMSGLYKIKDAQLKKMQSLAQKTLQKYMVTFCHVYREQNVRADLMANRGIDKLVPLPKKFLDFLQEYNVG